MQVLRVRRYARRVVVAPEMKNTTNRRLVDVEVSSEPVVVSRIRGIDREARRPVAVVPGTRMDDYPVVPMVARQGLQSRSQPEFICEYQCAT
jgi:hypothetical protein